MKIRPGMLALAVLLALPQTLRAAEAESPGSPSWYRKKKSAAKKAPAAAPEDPGTPVPSPSPAAVPSPTPLPSASPTPASAQTEVQATAEPSPSPEPGFLFKREGLTASLDLGLAYLSQPEISGIPLQGGYAMGWWWKPNVILGLSASAEAIFADSFTFMLFSLGPQIRYFTKDKSWAFRGSVGFAFSQGMSRVDAAHIPPPPADTALMARRGFLFGAQAAHFTWKKRDLAIGPALGFKVGWQGERSVFEVTAGFTYQDGRPTFAGDPPPDL